MPTTFADDVAGFAAGGCTAMEVWLTKLETQLERATVAETQQLVQDRGLSLVAAAYHGGLLLSQGEARRAAFDHFKHRLDLCQQFGIRTLILVADFVAKPEPTDLGRAMVSLVEAAQWAAGFDVRLALEFRGTDAFCTNLATAVALVEQCAQPNLGVCLDAFHFTKGPSKTEDLELLTPANLAHVQLCDVAGVPREWMTDSDRVFPGEGDLHLEAIVRRLHAIDYRGAVSLELMNPTLWKAKPSQVVELGLTALQRTLELGRTR